MPPRKRTAAPVKSIRRKRMRKARTWQVSFLCFMFFFFFVYILIVCTAGGPTSDPMAERLRNAAVARTATGTYTHTHVRGKQTTTRRRRLRLRWRRRLEKNLSPRSAREFIALRALVVGVAARVHTRNNIFIITIINYRTKNDFGKTIPE